MQINSYVTDQWLPAAADGRPVFNAVNGEVIGEVSSAGADFKAMLEYGRDVGGPGLRALTFHERANLLKAIGKHLMTVKERLYEISAWTGATRSDSWVDIEGGIGTFFSYSSIARRELPNDKVYVEGPMEMLSDDGSFVGRHVLTPRQGVALHINAFNFPCWGMLEKVAPSLIAGMPVVVKPATVSSYLTAAMVEEIIATGLLPRGALQLVCGGLGDTFDHLLEQDVVTFTGSAATGRKLKSHPTIVANAVPFNMEADSLNCSILGASAEPGDPEFDLFVREVAREMTIKAGQKCTAIRRIIVPAKRLDAVQSALATRLDRIPLGDPAVEGVRMGPLVGRDQVADLWENVNALAGAATVVYGGSGEFAVTGGDATRGAFFPSTLLRCEYPLSADAPHDIEPFGPVATLMPYGDLDEAVAIAARGRGSLVASVFTHDSDEARELVLGAAPWHGRILIADRDSAAKSTGHGSPLPGLVHGGPGRAGGGEEMGGVRGITHFMQRTALQGSPSLLTAVTNEYHRGGRVHSDAVHPFRKYFEELRIGDSITTHRRTVTEADIVNFGCLSGDHFYAHFDAIGAAESLFGKRVAHGYFVISAAAGMFVDPAPGPVLANYGLENLRFIEPVGIGDTIQVTVTVKKKIRKDQRPDEPKPTGVVIWDVEIRNQNDDAVALYDVLTLVERRGD